MGWDEQARVSVLLYYEIFTCIQFFTHHWNPILFLFDLMKIILFYRFQAPEHWLKQMHPADKPVSFLNFVSSFN